MNSQYPSRGTRTGVQIPSSPASNQVGCRPFVEQAFMHIPHSSAPIEELSLGSGRPGDESATGPAPSRARPPEEGTVPLRARPRARTPRRVRSTAAGLRPSLPEKWITSSGQTDWQSMHSMHSPWSVTATSPPIAAMRQFDSHSAERLLPAPVIRRRRSRTAPGAQQPPEIHRFRHQNRR